VSFVLRLDHIDKRFGPTIALDGGSLHVRRGTVHALLGENGAGKTTLMRVAFGMVRPDAGRIEWHGRQVAFPSPGAAMRAGLGMVHQHFTLVPAMSVAENVALGMYGHFTPSRAVERTLAVARAAGLRIDASERVRDLTVGGQQRAEIVKALVRDATLLILDEPTAVLSPNEAVELIDWMRRFADSGRSVVLITHKLREALRVADDVTVLRRGRTVLAASADGLTEAQLVSAMVGETPEHLSGSGGATVGASSATTVRLDAVSVRPNEGHRSLRELSITIRRGEIVGVAGVEGAGHRELLRLIAGRLAPTAGRVELPLRIAFIPEDRHRDALALTLPIYQNVALRGLRERRGIMPWSSIMASTERVIHAFDVRASGVSARAETLSGGNQQRLVLGRELFDRPDLIVAENPTRGLDVRATNAVIAHLIDARARGASVVVHSSDLDELLPIADRILVLFDGTARWAGVDREEISRLMLGAA
jgi:simple sugar transport system ATP-binding protein